MCQAVTPRFMDQYLIDAWSGLQLNTLKKQHRLIVLLTLSQKWKQMTKMGPFWGQSITEMNTTMRVK